MFYTMYSVGVLTNKLYLMGEKIARYLSLNMDRAFLCPTACSSDKSYPLA